MLLVFRGVGSVWREVQRSQAAAFRLNVVLGMGRCCLASRHGHGRGMGRAGGDRLWHIESSVWLLLSLHNHLPSCGDPQSPRGQRGEGYCSPGQVSGPGILKKIQREMWVSCNTNKRWPSSSVLCPTLGQSHSGGPACTLSPSSLSHEEWPVGLLAGAALGAWGPAGGPVTCAFALVLSPPE